MNQESKTLDEVIIIEDLARGGAGVGKDSNGRVIFVPLTAPGDEVTVKILETKKNYAQAELVELKTPSAIRQTPPCPVFGRCGGCQWQHLPYALQWETKFHGVLHALQRTQVTPPSKIDSFPADRIWEYRNRVQLRGSEGTLGFFKPGSRELVPIEKCFIARPEINDSLQKISDEAQRFRKPYKVEVEVLPHGETRWIWNARHGAMGFRQVHDDQNEKMKAWISQNLSSGKVLYDLFGGSGNFSLSLAPSMKEVYCVDVSIHPPDEKVPDHFHFQRAPVSTWIVKKAAQLSGVKNLEPAVAIIDPPRDGLGPDLVKISDSLKILGVKELIVIGCDPDSWARDLSRWMRKGWHFKQMMVIDLFPQTPHVESIALLGL